MTDRMTPAQIRGARGMLNWSMLDLATAAGVSVSTVKRMESEEPQPLSIDIKLAVWDAFVGVGVRFIADADGSGVVLLTR